MLSCCVGQRLLALLVGLRLLPGMQRDLQSKVSRSILW